MSWTQVLSIAWGFICGAIFAQSRPVWFNTKPGQSSVDTWGMGRNIACILQSLMFILIIPINYRT